MFGNDDKSILADIKFGCRHIELVQLTVSLFITVFKQQYCHVTVNLFKKH